MIILLCVSVVTAVAFVWWERRAAYPLLDMRLFRLARFTTPNVVAFCTYFATFAIFFFTALYLNEVVSASGYVIALTFLPMTILMIAASVVTGRWITTVGARWPITTGCVLFAAGLLLANAYVSPHPNYVGLGTALALAGLGIGVTVVPVTTAVLDAVPPDRSGMAASAANTSREIGAVTGVAILGALVTSRLTADLTVQLQQNHVPLAFKSLIVTALMTGQANPTQYAQYGDIVLRALNAAYAALGTGLHAALYLSAGLVLLAAILAVATLREREPATASATVTEQA